jgi:uncharacterized membrane protein (UPF0127 family)
MGAAVLMIERTHEPLATEVELAVTRRARNRGLLGRDGLDPSAAIILAPCTAVHTAFMRFAIDVLFLDRDGCAVKIVANVGPWRIALAARAYAVVEMAAGSALKHGVQVGDRLYVSPEGV